MEWQSTRSAHHFHLSWECASWGPGRSCPGPRIWMGRGLAEETAVTSRIAFQKGGWFDAYVVRTTLQRYLFLGSTQYYTIFWVLIRLSHNICNISHLVKYVRKLHELRHYREIREKTNSIHIKLFLKCTINA